MPFEPSQITEHSFDFECKVQPCPGPVDPNTYLMQPGETRFFRGQINFPFEPIRGLCATSGMREAVHFDFAQKLYTLADRCDVSVTLDPRARAAFVRPALYVAARDELEEPLQSNRSARLLRPQPMQRVWRTVLPLERLLAGNLVDAARGPVEQVTLQPDRVFRPQKIIIEPGPTPWGTVDLDVELRAANFMLWLGGVPAGIFVRAAGYEIPTLDGPTLVPAQRLDLAFASRGTRHTVRGKVVGPALRP